jgi:HEAT repeat protein
MNVALLALLAALPIAQVKLPRVKPRNPPLIQSALPLAVALGDEEVFKNIPLDTSGRSLLDFFRKRATAGVEKDYLSGLAKQLGDKTLAVHAKATAEIVGFGPLTVPLLRQLVNRVDEEETANRARKCLEAIEGRNSGSLVQAAVRLLVVRNPPGSAEALLDYLPFANNDTIVQEIETALLTVGQREGKPELALSRALRDPVPVRRSIAARVLCQIGGTAGRNAVHPLLKDARPTVRMQAALGLADRYDAEAVPVLIELVAELSPEGRRQVEAYLTELAGDWAVKTPQGNDAMAGRLRRELWSAWWHSLDGNNLLEEFRSRTLTNDERTHLLERIRKLDDVSADIRAKASEEITSVGPRASALLRQVISQAHPRLSALCRQCLETIERDTRRPLPDVAPRLLTLRRPKGSLEAMLAYVPFAENETLAALLTESLAVVGCTDGKADAALRSALQDEVPARRAAAAVALCKGKASDEMDAVRKLLRDPENVVRMKTALALVERGDKIAMPVLIALLGELSVEQVWEVEDLLLYLAGEKAPNERVGADAASRKASVTAWGKWWTKEEKTLDLVKLRGANRDRGLLLVIEQQNPMTGQGRVLELSASGKVRWQIEGLIWPWDAQVCPNGNVLVIEQSQHLRERDRKGKVLWEKMCNNVFSCQRLGNGNIFVLGRNQLLELDSAGKEVFAHNYPQGYILGGWKFPNGHMAFVTYQGQYIKLDSTGKQVKTFHVPFNSQNGVIGAEVLPGDRVLVSLGSGKVAEYADGGRLVWETTVFGPGFPHRLVNGHTLVPSNNNTVLLELDRNGKVISEKKDLNYNPYRVHRR